MGDLLIRNIPDGLKDELAKAAAREGKSLSSEAIDVLRKGLQIRHRQVAGGGKSAWDVLRPILFDENDPEGSEEFASYVEEAEALRKTDFGRPLPDLE